MEREEYLGLKNRLHLIIQLLKVSGGIWMKKKLKISLDSKVAKDLKLNIGDSITFNIYGKSVSGIITNFRKS